MKKTMAMLLSAAMVMSMGLMASAATQDYSVLVDGDKLTLTNGETRAVYQLDESRLVLSQSSEGGIAVSFSVEDEENKKVTLGSQKDVTVSGDLDRLNISQSLDKEYNIYLDKMPMCATLFQRRCAHHRGRRGHPRLSALRQCQTDRKQQQATSR